MFSRTCQSIGFRAPRATSRRALGCASLLTVAFAAAGCGGGGHVTSSGSTSSTASTATASTGASGAKAGAKRTRIKLGISLGNSADPLQAALASELAARAKTLHALVFPVANAGGAGSKQASDIASLVSGGAKDLIVVPTADATAVGPALTQAQAKGVGVVVLGRPAPAKVNLDVRSNDTVIGRLACAQIATLIGRSGEVLDVQGDPKSSSAKDLTTSFKTCIARFKHITLIPAATGGSGAAAGGAVGNALRSHPKLRGIVIESDAAAGSSVLAAMRTAGRAVPTGAARHVFTLAIDGSQSALAAVRAGIVDEALVRLLPLYARIGFNDLLLARRGKQLKLKTVVTDSFGTPTVELGAYRVTKTAVFLGKNQIGSNGAANTNLWANQHP